MAPPTNTFTVTVADAHSHSVAQSGVAAVNKARRLPLGHAERGRPTIRFQRSAHGRHLDHHCNPTVRPQVAQASPRTSAGRVAQTSVCGFPSVLGNANPSSGRRTRRGTGDGSGNPQTEVCATPGSAKCRKVHRRRRQRHTVSRNGKASTLGARRAGIGAPTRRHGATMDARMR